MLKEVFERIDRLESKMQSIVRIGIVKSLYSETGTVRVLFSDADDTLSDKLLVLFHKTHEDKHYSMPSLEEQVLCVFLPFGLEQGFVVGSMYNADDTVVTASNDKTYIKFKDNTLLEYDRKSHKLTIDVQSEGDVDINVGGSYQENIDGDVNINVGGNSSLRIDGDAEVSIGGSAELDVDSGTTLTTPLLTLNGNQLINGSIAWTGTAAALGGGAAKFSNGIENASGDVRSNGISLENHTHSDVESGSESTGGPQ